MTFGIFKENYRGYGIWWSGTYNVNGNGEYRTLQDTKEAIDRHITEEEQPQTIPDKCLLARRDGQNVTIQTPDGEISCTIIEFRRDVFFLEEKYKMSVYWE